MLEELEALTEGLLAQAGASHYPALQLSMRTNEARRAQQQLTRRMMAAVSELSLYQVRGPGCLLNKSQGARPAWFVDRADPMLMADRLMAYRPVGHGVSHSLSHSHTRTSSSLAMRCRLLQALSLKCAADREALKSQLAAAQLEVAAGRPPTAGAEQVRYELMNAAGVVHSAAGIAQLWHLT